jgi:hypothetical protein
MALSRSQRFRLGAALIISVAGAAALVFAASRPRLTGLSETDRGIAISCRSLTGSVRHDCYRAAF